MATLYMYTTRQEEGSSSDRYPFSVYHISYTVPEIMLPAARAPGAVWPALLVFLIYQQFSFPSAPPRSGARFSGQDLWNGTLYSSILAYASIYSPQGRLIPKLSTRNVERRHASTATFRDWRFHGGMHLAMFVLPSWLMQLPLLAIFVILNERRSDWFKYE